MTVMLTKGGNVSLSLVAPGLTRVIIGLGWQARMTSGVDFDLDASALLVNSTGRVLSDAHFVFYGNLRSPDGTVQHSGDNLTGGTGGDDEQIHVDLAEMDPWVSRIVFPVSIYDADVKRQNFGQVGNAFIRIVDAVTLHEVARYDLTEDASSETAMIFGELYRYKGEWKFRAVGQGYDSGLRGIAVSFGVNVT